MSVNEGYGPGWASVHAPMGGYKESGVGRRHGKDGILKYTESTTVATQRLVSMGGPSFIPLKIWNGKILDHRPHHQHLSLPIPFPGDWCVPLREGWLVDASTPRWSGRVAS
ncbi:MAG: hypothetical protein U1U88_001235 [Lawsonella clevelandensis]